MRGGRAPVARPGTRGERGGALVELVLFLPLLLFLAAAAATTARFVLAYGHVAELSQAGARYATRAALDPARPGAYRLRPSAEEIADYVAGIAQVRVGAVEVVPEPSSALPGTAVTVTVRAHVAAGPLGGAALALANSFAGLFGESPPFPAEGLELSSTTVMREE